MPKKCDACSFFSPENELSVCPECGGALRFTMFAPPGYEAAEPEPAGAAKPWDESMATYEVLEQPLAVRMTQIGAGVGAYFTISFMMTRVLVAMFFQAPTSGDVGAQLGKMLGMFLLILVGSHVTGALVGGAVAGAWSKNWVPQGVGVGLGVFLLPLAVFFLFPPEHAVAFVVFFAIICFTTMVAVMGAFVGHLLVRPSRFLR